jgi:hypothetical protein
MFLKEKEKVKNEKRGRTLRIKIKKIKKSILSNGITTCISRSPTNRASLVRERSVVQESQGF